MKLGLVGLPKVGKKTLFELLTGQSPGMDRPLPGLADVRDERFEKLVEEPEYTFRFCKRI